MQRESARAKTAWADYLALGPGRSLEKLAREYRSRGESGVAVPTRQLSRLTSWSQHHAWQDRLAEIADRAATEAEAGEAEYRRSIMEHGYALAHERVRVLNVLAERLIEEMLSDDPESARRWLADVKQIGIGESAERVDIERFNAAGHDQLRKVLDDLAKETGGRAQKHELTGHDGGPIPIQQIIVELPRESA